LVVDVTTKGLVPFATFDMNLLLWIVLFDVIFPNTVSLLVVLLNVNDELPAPTPDYFFNNTAAYFNDLLIQNPISTSTANINFNQQLQPTRPTVAILNNDDISNEPQIIKRKKRNCANILNQ
jgi:hypothetical protein